jgi:hypothetical protein
LYYNTGQLDLDGSNINTVLKPDYAMYADVRGIEINLIHLLYMLTQMVRLTDKYDITIQKSNNNSKGHYVYKENHHGENKYLAITTFISHMISSDNKLANISMDSEIHIKKYNKNLINKLNNDIKYLCDYDMTVVMTMAK